MANWLSWLDVRTRTWVLELVEKNCPCDVEELKHSMEIEKLLGGRDGQKSA
jgi:hypothetical protein